MKQKDGKPYGLQRRLLNKRTGKALSGYALDFTVRVNGDGAYFLDDHNADRDAMPHNDRKELIETLLSELDRHHAEHFGAA